MIKKIAKTLASDIEIKVRIDSTAQDIWAYRIWGFLWILLIITGCVLTYLHRSLSDFGIILVSGLAISPCLAVSDGWSDRGVIVGSTRIGWTPWHIPKLVRVLMQWFFTLALAWAEPFLVALVIVSVSAAHCYLGHQFCYWWAFHNRHLGDWGHKKPKHWEWIKIATIIGSTLILLILR